MRLFLCHFSIVVIIILLLYTSCVITDVNAAFFHVTTSNNVRSIHGTKYGMRNINISFQYGPRWRTSSSSSLSMFGINHDKTRKQRLIQKVKETNEDEANIIIKETKEEEEEIEEKEEKEEMEIKQKIKNKKEMKSVSARYVYDNDLRITLDEEGRVTARPVSSGGKSGDDQQRDDISSSLIENDIATANTDVLEKNKPKTKDDNNITNDEEMETEEKKIIIPGITLPTMIKTAPMVEDVPKPVINGSFNVVLTHCTADFDSLASAVGLAKLWSASNNNENPSPGEESTESTAFESSSTFPTFVVLPRGAHPSVQRFLALHKHLFPIRSLRSLPNDLSKLHRLGLVDAQSRDRVGPAEILIQYADRVTIVDHHIDGTSDIPEATDYIIDKVGAVSTMVTEQLRDFGLELTEAEATLLALGIHADTGSLCFDSATPRDAEALTWVMNQGASQAAIAEHAHSQLSREQQGVLTNALINTNSTIVHGVTVSTVLLSADGFINGLAAVTQDALELSSSDVFLLAVVYDPKSGGSGQVRLQSQLLKTDEERRKLEERNSYVMEAEAWKGGERALRIDRLRAAFDTKDADGNGYLEENELFKALMQSGVIASESSLKSLMAQMDTDGNGKIDFSEFVSFADKAEQMQKEEEKRTGKRSMTMIVIGRVKAGVNMKHVNLNNLFQQFGGGGHAKAASCTVRLEDECKASDVLQGIVDELIDTGLMKQPTVGDFMTSPVLSAKPTMYEKQVEDLLIRYDVRALPVVDENNDVIGLVTYKEVAAAKQRLWNKEQKRLRKKIAVEGKDSNGKKSKKSEDNVDIKENRKLGSALKGWMKQHVKTVETSTTMAEVEQILLENDVGCIPVVADGTMQLVGMVTRTDLLRQHRYYQSLHYNNKGFADSIAARKPIIELRKRLKQFDIDED